MTHWKYKRFLQYAAYGMLHRICWYVSIRLNKRWWISSNLVRRTWSISRRIARANMHKFILVHSPKEIWSVSSNCWPACPTIKNWSVISGLSQKTLWQSGMIDSLNDENLKNIVEYIITDRFSGGTAVQNNKSILTQHLDS